MAIKKTSILIDSTYETNGIIPLDEFELVPIATSTEKTFESLVAGDGHEYSSTILSSNFNSVHFGGNTDVVVKKVELEFWHNNSDSETPIETIEIVRFDGDPTDPVPGTAFSEVMSATGENIYKTQSLHGYGKNLMTVVLGSSSTDTICELLTTAINEEENFFSVAIRRTELTTYGEVYIGGQTLLKGEGEIWEEASSNEIKSPARFIITWDREVEDNNLNVLKYTTSDPTDTNGQQTPKNSIGGYISSNEIFSSGINNENISKTDTLIQLRDDSDLPSDTSGLLLIGNEIIRYGSVDNSSQQIGNITRSIAPTSPFPAPPSFDSFVREPIYYLEIDKIFDQNTINGLDQYRCVAIQRSVGASNISNISLYLLQDVNNDVSIDIGIEVPQFDSRTSATIDSPGIPTGRSFFSSHSSVVAGLSSGYFNGGHIIIDPSGATNGPVHAIIESSDISAGKSEFILDRNIPEFVGDTPFRISPAPSQRVANDITEPEENEFFFGFFGNDGSNTVTFSEHDEMQPYDVFYVWIKKTIKNNVMSSLDSGAVIVMKFDNSNEEES